MKKLITFILSILLLTSVYATDPLRIPEERLSKFDYKTAMIFKSAADTAEIDLMIVYTTAATQWASTRGGILNRINEGMALSQKVLNDSGVGIKLNLVHTYEIDYPETGNSLTDLRRLTHSNFDTTRYFEKVHELRDSVGADLVILVPSTGNAAGLAWQLSNANGRPTYGFSVVMVHYINQFTKVHEMGHNMGAHHAADQLVAPGPGLFPFSAGYRFYGIDNKLYSTIMSYTSSSHFSSGGNSTRIGLFSTPLKQYQGTTAGDYITADNVRTLREVKHTIAAYRTRVVSPPTEVTTSLRILDITPTTIKVNPVFTGENITGKGVFWGIDTTVALKEYGDTITLKDLSPSTSYFFKSFTETNDTIVKSGLYQVTTQNLPELGAALKIINITSTTIKVNPVSVGENVLYVGIFWGADTINLFKDYGDTILIEGLQPDTPYFFKAFAEDSNRTVLSEWYQITTLPIPLLPPSFVHANLLSVTHNEAKFLVAAQGDSIIWMGIKWSKDTSFNINGIADSDGRLTIQGLSPSTTYNYVPYAINPAGEYIGGAQGSGGIIRSYFTFTTKEQPTTPEPPEITNQIIVYPNPSTGVVYITYNGKFKFTVYSIIPARRVYMRRIVMVDNIVQFNIPQRGLYVVDVIVYGEGKPYKKSFNLIITQ